MKKGRSERNPVHHTSAVSAYFDQVPARVELEHAADILNRGKKIAILAGQGALHATQELEELAEMLGAPIVKASARERLRYRTTAPTRPAASAFLEPSHRKMPSNNATRF